MLLRQHPRDRAGIDESLLGQDLAEPPLRLRTRLRIFAADDGRFDLSLLDVLGSALVVSQFTLLADSKRQKGTRPDFHLAARPEVAEPIYVAFCDSLRGLGVPVQTGVYGALMDVELVNDGPVTIVLDSGAFP